MDKVEKIILHYFIMASGSFSLGGLVGSLFGSNKKSRSRSRGHSSRRHICTSKCRHGKKGHICNSKCMHMNKYSKKRFNMRGG